MRTLEYLAGELAGLGHEVCFATPQGHPTVPLPTYPEIRVALFPRSRLLKRIEEFSPDAIHVATEGPLGHAARAICIKRQLPFTTSLTTRFPEYLRLRMPFLPESWAYDVLRRFHAPARKIMVSTTSFIRELEGRGFQNVRLWSRGVDTGLFKPSVANSGLAFGSTLARPIFLFVGRVAVEKNVDDFLKLALPGTKIVVGDGPGRSSYEKCYPSVRFLGRRAGAELAALYASSDVFVFPSRTDTYGLVMLEALACGVPVAAYPVQAPKAVLGEQMVGVLNQDLREACLQALSINRTKCREFALTKSWKASALQFVANLEPIAPINSGY